MVDGGSEMKTAIKADNLHKSYGARQAVRGISFEVPEGCVYGFLGPNGAGKTSTLRMLMDIIRPDRGEIEILGSRDIARIRPKIGYLPEEKGLYKSMTAISFMTYLGVLKGMNSSHARRVALDYLDQFQMADYAKTRLSAMSKGQGQKIQFLSSILHDPEIIIFDEPFSGLDPVNQQSLERLIQKLASDGKTVIFSTHVMQHAERLCDRFLLISSGQKVFDGDLAAARDLLPHKAVISGDKSLEPLKSLAGVRGLVPGLDSTRAGAGDSKWELIMDKDVSPHQILEFCYKNQIGINHFEFSKPALHDVFVHLVENG